jgi:hypothetical protein
MVTERSRTSSNSRIHLGTSFGCQTKRPTNVPVTFLSTVPRCPCRSALRNSASPLKCGGSQIAMPTESHLGSVTSACSMPSLLYSPDTETTFPTKVFGSAQIAQTVVVMVRLPVSAKLCKEHATIAVPIRTLRRPFALFIGSSPSVVCSPRIRVFITFSRLTPD